MASKGPAGKRESQGATTAKNKQDIIEVEILTNTFFCQALSQVEEDNFNFEAVASTTVYPVFCQPLLVALNTVNENTKFVKFSLNKTIQVRHLSTFQEVFLKMSSRVKPMLLIGSFCETVQRSFGGGRSLMRLPR